MSPSRGADKPARGAGGIGEPGDSAHLEERRAGRHKVAARDVRADFKAVFDDAPSPLVVFTPHDFEIVAANEAFQRATLTDSSRLLGKRIFDVFPGSVNPATQAGQQQLAAELENIASARRPGVLPLIRFDVPNPDSPDGLEPRWWSQVVSPLLNHEGEVAFLISQLEDVTEAIQPRTEGLEDADPAAANVLLREANLALVREVEVRRRAESKLRRAAELDDYRLRLADTLRRNSDPVSVVRESLRLLGEQLEADYAYFSEIDETETYFRIDQHYVRGDLDSLVGRYPIESYGELSQRLRKGETCVIGDTAADPSINEVTRKSMLSHGIVSTISTSLVKENRWLALLTVHSNTSREWSDTDVALVVETADRAWSAYQRARAEDQLRQNAETFLDMVKQVPFGMYTVDADLRIVQASPTAHRTFGLPDLIGSSLATALRVIWQEPFATAAIERFRQTLATGEKYVSKDTVEMRADREAREAFDWRLERITLTDGRYGVVCYYYDLTQQHDLERLLRASRDRQTFLLELADASQDAEPVAIMRKACRLLGTRLQTNRVVITKVEKDHFVPLASYSRDVPRLQARKYPVEAYRAVFDGGEGGAAEAVIEDVGKHPRFTRSDREVCESLQVAAIARVGITADGPLLGSLTLHQSTPRAWSELELDLLFEVAYRVGAAVERARARSDLDRLNDSLQAQIAARTQELKRSEAVRKAIQETLSEATNFRRSVIERLRTAKIKGERRDLASPLSPRETEVLSHLAAGKADDAIAVELGIAKRTVRNHVNNIYAKLNVKTRSQAIVWAQENGLVG